MNAVEAIKTVYDKQDLEEIARYGCESGVCRQHIYYGDTVKFYDNNEDEVLDLLTDSYTNQFLVDLFRDADADLTFYKNQVVWNFIETIANEVVEEDEIRGYQLNQLVEAV